jgi:hypothetical protein
LFLWTCTWPALPFGFGFHTEWNARNSAARKRLKNAAISTTAVTCDAVRMQNILDTAEIMFCSRDVESASRDDIHALFSWKNVVRKVPDCSMKGMNATVGIRADEFRAAWGTNQN